MKFHSVHVYGIQVFKFCSCASLQVMILMSVACNGIHEDLVYVRWFESPADEWNHTLNLRPLQWQRCASTLQVCYDARYARYDLARYHDGHYARYDARYAGLLGRLGHHLT